jgi:glycerol-3-phosphate dehydrogenase
MTNAKIETQVAVIGGGITGTAIVRELSKYKLDSTLIEKEAAFGFGITKACQGLLHGGITYLASRAVKFHGGMDFEKYLRQPFKLKDILGSKGREEYFYMAPLLNVELHKPGIIFPAETDEDIKTMNIMRDVGVSLGVTGLEILDRKGLEEREPLIGKRWIAALFDPHEGILVASQWAQAFGEHAQQNGAHILKETEVQGIEEKKGYYLIKTNKGVIQAEYVINAAGIYTDRIAAMVGAANFEMTGWKCEILVTENRNYCRHVLLTVPRPQKVHVVIPTTHNSLLFSHTFGPMINKEERATTQEGFDDLRKWPDEMFQGFAKDAIISTFAGYLNWNTKDPDDHLMESPKRGFINVVVGAPGIGPAPAIGREVARMLAEQGLEMLPRTDFNPYRLKEHRFIELPTEEKKALIKKEPNYGHMVCRCMHVSDQEIRSVVRAGAKTLDEIKFEALAGMGRCQGGFCTSRVVKIISEELNISPLEVTKKGAGSEILKRETKSL